MNGQSRTVHGPIKAANDISGMNGASRWRLTTCSMGKEVICRILSD